MTGPMDRIDIRGRGGRLLRDKWSEGPRTYLGLTSHGYPNLFTITGPQSPSVLSNMPVSIEQHVDFIAQIIGDMRERGATTIEPTREAEDAWVTENQQLAEATLFPTADTWYMGANIPGKPRVFLPNLSFVGGYRQKCDAIAADGYRGFRLRRSRLRRKGHGMIENQFYTHEFHGDYELISIGRLDLEEGGSIPDCQLAVTTWGELNEAKDNAILITTWYSGTHQIWRDVYVGPDHALNPDALLHRGDQPDRQRPLDLAAQRRRAERGSGHVAASRRSASATTSSPRSGCCASTSASSGSSS